MKYTSSAGKRKSASKRKSIGKRKSVSKRRSASKRRSVGKRRSSSKPRSASKRRSAGKRRSASKRRSAGKRRSMSKRKSAGKRRSPSKRRSASKHRSVSKRRSVNKRRNAIKRLMQKGGAQKLPVEIIVEIISKIDNLPTMIKMCKDHSELCTFKQVNDQALRLLLKLKDHDLIIDNLKYFPKLKKNKDLEIRIAKLHLTKCGFFLPTTTEPSESRPTRQIFNKRTLTWTKYDHSFAINFNPAILLLTTDLPPLTNDQIVYIYENLKNISPRLQINIEVLEKVKKLDNHQILLDFIFMNLEKAFIDINSIVSSYVKDPRVSKRSLDRELNRFPYFYLDELLFYVVRMEYGVFMIDTNHEQEFLIRTTKSKMTHVLEKLISLGADPNVGLKAISAGVAQARESTTGITHRELKDRAMQFLTNFFRNKLQQ